MRITKNHMSKYNLVALSVTGGILSGLAWTGWCSGLILLIALVPFLIIENHLYINRRRFSKNACFIYVLPGFVIFSIIAIGWMRIASITGAVCVIMGLSFLMSFAIWLSHIIHLKAGNIPGYIAFLSFWLTYEFLSLNISIISPWLNLGNGLARDIMFIQWYDVTGTAGGSLWILLSNLSLALLIINYLEGKGRTRLSALLWLSIIIIPPAVSIVRYHTIKTDNGTAYETVIIQPNTDPYTDKFTTPFAEQLKKVISMAGSAVTDNTSWIITPETTVDDPVNLDGPDTSRYVRMLKDFAGQHPAVSVVTGMVTYRLYPPSPEAPTKTARRIDLTGSYYDHFNSALKIDTSKVIEVYHKSKLVPGIEMQFSEGPGKILTWILPYLGGTKWGYGTQDERTCFRNSRTGQIIGPIICYESVFGEFVAGYVKNGAQALFIITNDGWWKNTTGYKQHLNYASVRAIETRRQIARSANTGVSCIINIRGEMTSKSGWWTETAIRGNITSESRITPYVKYGDYILRIATLISVIIILINFIAIPVRKKIS